MRLRDLTRGPGFQRAAGFLAAEYLRLVWLTNRFSYDPPDFYQRVDPHLPAIITFWHGQHFMVPFLKRDYHRAKVLISRHRDGEINAIAAERLGVGTVRGSGDHGVEFQRKGGVSAFKNMLQTLAEGSNMATTADVPKVARVAGRGVIMLARESGRPIFPFAMATSRFKRFDNWDRSVMGLPFGRGAMVTTDPIFVPRDADDAAMETYRLRLQDALTDVTRRAYAMVGREDSHG
jgi:lysophospholipid acyltransferase (LPLAT)-like uncharacterized protein